MSPEPESKLQREDSFAQLRQRILNAFLSRRVSPEDAQDMTQKTMLILVSKYATVESPLDRIRLAYGIMNRLLLELHHGRKLEQEPEDGWKLVNPERGIEDELVRRERAALLEAAVGKLDGRCRQVTRLRLEEKSRTEIADILGITANHAGVLESRCLERLQKIMGVPSGKEVKV